MTREAIFISHATPEDNEFVRWLGFKLELAGYKVWHDLARLKGGDYLSESVAFAEGWGSERLTSLEVAKVAARMDSLPLA